MRLPFWIRENSRIPGILGRVFNEGKPFLAVTIGPVICFPGKMGAAYNAAQIIVHEIRHVDQFYAAWAIGLALWCLVRPVWWWLILTPLSFEYAYWLAGFAVLLFGGSFHHDNPFERDARRHAREPIE